MKKIAFFLCLIVFISCNAKDKMSLTSPDQQIVVNLYNENGEVKYDLHLHGKQLLEPSPLGIVTEQADLSSNLKWSYSDEIKEVVCDYPLTFGKKSQVKASYNERLFSFKNEAGEQLDIIFRAGNDGVAFAYQLHGTGGNIILQETSGFKLPAASTAFVSPLAKAKTFWARTNPSYEDQYQRDIPVGTLSDYGQGWVFPALFKVGNDAWLLVSETGVDGKYAASHLADNSENGLYKVEFAHADHSVPADPATISVQLPFTTPWRTINVGETLQPIVASTLAQDLVTPKYEAKYTYSPGRATWSWLVLKDESVNYQTSKEFIDMASALNFEYCLIDNYWDPQIGKEKMAELAEYAKEKNVGLILWYNSNGSWNDAPQTPKDRMIDREIRRTEMAWLQQIGVKGIKVDFFGGDKQNTMQLYEDILRDANDFGIVVNFHGCTLPRGWDRMFPNFVTDEAVMGMEFCTFEQKNEDLRPLHATTLPFTRNVVAPMDFTPVILNPRLWVKPDEGNYRVTTAAFELALPVVFYSAVQHFGLVPDNLKQFPDFVWDYFKQIPTVWDETMLIDGYPGKNVIMARRKASTWYVAGINGENQPAELSFSLPFLNHEIKAKCIVDQENSRNELTLQPVVLKHNAKVTMPLQAHGGFVLIIEMP